MTEQLTTSKPRLDQIGVCHVMPKVQAHVKMLLTQKCSVVESRSSTPKMASEPDKFRQLIFDIGKFQCEDPDLKMSLNGYKRGLGPIGEKFLI